MKEAERPKYGYFNFTLKGKGRITNNESQREAGTWVREGRGREKREQDQVWARKREKKPREPSE